MLVWQENKLLPRRLNVQYALLLLSNHLLFNKLTCLAPSEGEHRMCDLGTSLDVATRQLVDSGIRIKSRGSRSIHYTRQRETTLQVTYDMTWKNLNEVRFKSLVVDL